jgi:hypothetical protein
VSCDPADAADLTALCGRAGKVRSITLLFCLSWACQATVVGGGFADLSTAFTGVVGTY